MEKVVSYPLPSDVCCPYGGYLLYNPPMTSDVVVDENATQHTNGTAPVSQRLDSSIKHSNGVPSVNLTMIVSFWEPYRSYFVNISIDITGTSSED